MSSIFPFAALRPVPQAARAVAAVPYDVVNTEEARALAAGNPLSFLHVSRPEIDLPPGVDPHSSEVYAKAAENFSLLKAKAPLVMEETPTSYVYRLRMGRHVQTGVARTDRAGQAGGAGTDDENVHFVIPLDALGARPFRNGLTCATA